MNQNTTDEGPTIHAAAAYMDRAVAGVTQALDEIRPLIERYAIEWQASVGDGGSDEECERFDVAAGMRGLYEAINRMEEKVAEPMYLVGQIQCAIRELTDPEFRSRPWAASDDMRAARAVVRAAMDVGH